MKRKGSTDDGSIKDYYWKVFDAKRGHEDWAKNIPLDVSTFHSIHHRCLYCGNPNMEESMNGAECKKCGIKRLIDTYGYEEEAAKEEYEHRKKKKEETMKFYELARDKKVSNTKREVVDPSDLPF